MISDNYVKFEYVFHLTIIACISFSLEHLDNWRETHSCHQSENWPKKMLTRAQPASARNQVSSAAYTHQNVATQKKENGWKSGSRKNSSMKYSTASNGSM